MRDEINYGFDKEWAALSDDERVRRLENTETAPTSKAEPAIDPMDAELAKHKARLGMAKPEAKPANGSNGATHTGAEPNGAHAHHLEPDDVLLLEPLPEPPPDDGWIPPGDKPHAHQARAQGGQTEQKPAEPKFKLTWLDDIEVGADPACLVDGILPLRGLAEIIGPPKSLKTFFLTHVFMHVAANLKYCGRDVQAGAVIYITSEGVRGFMRRMVAMRRKLGIEGKNVPFAVITVMPNLGTATGDIDTLRANIRSALAELGNVPLRGIGIDTLRRATPGKAENKSEDMGPFIANCGTLETDFECLVCAVHHTPRADNKHGSGTNAVDGAADVIIGMERTDNDTRPAKAAVTILRMKDGEEGDTWSFRIEGEEVGIDRNGKPIKAGYLVIETEPAPAEVHKTKPRTRLNDREELARRELANLLCDSEHRPPCVPGGGRAVKYDDWREAAYRKGFASDMAIKTRNKTFQRVSDKLQNLHIIGRDNDWIWLGSTKGDENGNR